MSVSRCIRVNVISQIAYCRNKFHHFNLKTLTITKDQYFIMKYIDKIIKKKKSHNPIM